MRSEPEAWSFRDVRDVMRSDRGGNVQHEASCKGECDGER
jgi:hypothetical protein